MWGQLCARRGGDLDRAGLFGGAGDVASSDGWSPGRELRAEFIEAILTRPEFTDHLANMAVEISGAWIREPIDLEGASIHHPLYFFRSRFEAGLGMRGVRFDGNVGLDGSAVAGELNLDGAALQGSLLLRDVHLDVLEATEANIGDLVALNGSNDRKSVFRDVVDLNNADIGGNLYLGDAEYSNLVDLIGADVGGAVFANRSVFRQHIWMEDAQVGGQLVVAGSKMHGLVDLTAAQIGGTLALTGADGPVSWKGTGPLRLVAATVNAIDDDEHAWPAEVHLEGFTLHHAHGQGYTAGEAFINRSVDWYVDWLQRDDGYSRGAYLQLETLLRSSGRQNEADDIGMARAAEDAASSTWLRQHVIGPVYRYTVGYGYHPEWAVFWVIGLVLVGSLVALRLPREHLDEKGAASRVILSAHRLIPLISFGQAYSEVDITSRRVPRYVRWYFYLHAVLGYVLAAALVAALSGAIATG